MKTTFSWSWRSAAYAIACGTIAFASLFPNTLLAQRDRGGGKGGGGGQGGVRVGGGEQGGAKQGGANVRASGQAGGQAGARVGEQGGGQAGARVGGQGGVRVEGGGARVQGNAPAATGGAQIRTPQASGGARVQGNAPAAPGGAQIRTPQASGGAQVRTPDAAGGARITTPSVTGGAQVRTPQASGGAQIRTPQASGGADIRTPGAAADARIRTPGANIGADANVPNVAGRANVGGEARTALRPDVDAGARANADARVRANWANAPPQRRDAFRSSFDSALNANARATNRSMANWLDSNPNRASYWSNWGGNVRNNFTYGRSPYFNGGFWNGRNLVGLGLATAGVGGGYGYGYGSYPIGGAGPGWWGYSPWASANPWNYWYGNPGWNTFAGYYGWNTPYYYDYGPNGNVVYRGNTVYVNDQLVGTPADYSGSAAELAVVTEDQMNAPHEWMPLGTFSVATSQNETNPARVAQLAYDNKQGLISGTIFNRESGNLYAIQGRVDPQTQRVAFTIGKDPNVVMETGLYNLTQQETPVLVHFGPSKTETYLFARLPEPQQSEQPTTTATGPADDFRR